MKKLKIIAVTLLSLLAVGFVLPKYTLAVNPSIIAEPDTLQSELTFDVSAGQLDKRVGVKITTSNTQVKYIVRQFPQGQLFNGRNEISWENLKFYGLDKPITPGVDFSASRSQVPQPFGVFDPIYKNDAATADNFTLVYSLKVPDDAIAGSTYTGQLKFSLIPQESGQNEAYYFLKIVINVKSLQLTAAPEEKAAPPAVFGKAFEVQPTGLRLIRLKNNQRESAYEVAVKINRPFSEQFSIVQKMSRPLSSGANQLNPSLIKFETKGITKGSAVSATELSEKEEEIYTSLVSGEADESFVIAYSLGQIPAEQRPGTYKSTVEYYLLQAGHPTLIDTLDLEVEVEGYISLEMTTPDKTSNVVFKDLKPSEEPKRNEIIVEIKTNKASRYEVHQKAATDLTCQQTGETIPSKYFSFKLESLDTKGKLASSNWQEVVKDKEETLFVSEDGVPDKFKIIYQLEVPADISACDYNANIAYSLTE
jgi:hypothetical protein